MIETFVSGGVPMWIITIAGLVMVWAVVRGVMGLRAPQDPAGVVAGADGVLFWAVFAGLFGLLGTLIGIMQAAGAIRRAGEVNEALAWAGVRVALISTVYGLLILLLGLLAWGALRLALRHREGGGHGSVMEGGR
jgi:MotA/TolQ/ExbB proton channel family